MTSLSAYVIWLSLVFSKNVSFSPLKAKLEERAEISNSVPGIPHGREACDWLCLAAGMAYSNHAAGPSSSIPKGPGDSNFPFKMMSFAMCFPYGLVSFPFGLFLSVNMCACAGLRNTLHNNSCLEAYFIFGRVQAMPSYFDHSKADSYFIATFESTVG